MLSVDVFAASTLGYVAKINNKYKIKQPALTDITLTMIQILCWHVME